jgi:LPS export ABC transporter protein LptC
MRVFFRELTTAIAGVVLLVSCGGGDKEAPAAQENIMTMRSDTLTITQSKNGALKGQFSTPLMQEYAYAPEPYQEYPRGVDFVTYDSVGGQESHLRANYALFWIDLERWDLKGDVVYTTVGGDKLETQQLTWNQKSELIWSNVSTRLTRTGDVQTGAGFTSTQDLRKWSFRRVEGTQSFVAEPNREARADTVTAK